MYPLSLDYLRVITMTTPRIYALSLTLDGDLDSFINILAQRVPINVPTYIRKRKRIEMLLHYTELVQEIIITQFLLIPHCKSYHIAS